MNNWPNQRIFDRENSEDLALVALGALFSRCIWPFHFYKYYLGQTVYAQFCILLCSRFAIIVLFSARFYNTKKRLRMLFAVSIANTVLQSNSKRVAGKTLDYEFNILIPVECKQ